MRKNIFFTVLVFISFVIFSTCDLEKDNSEKGFYFDEVTFTNNWNEWKNKNIQNYCFTMDGELPHWNFSRAILMYEYKVNIKVKNGVMDSFEYISNIPYEDDMETILEPEFTSISDMYQKISDSAKEEKEWWENHFGNDHIVLTKYNLEYDTNLCYITFFEPVSKWKPDVIVDTIAHAVKITNFNILDEE